MKFLRREDRRFYPEKVRLPLVALIDVVFFLLIYFVTAGTLAGEEAQLPSALRTESQGRGRGSDLAPQVLYVEPGAPGKARFRIGERTMDSRDALTVVLRQLPRENGVIVRVSSGITVESAAAALQATRDAGFQKVSYVPAR
ncbi:MAG: biopolymer transporter ExbD [Phycisphaeraceae bacterium]|nr:biopolymer transporter ExbD [Phycisphaeraceae bacterium]